MKIVKLLVFGTFLMVCNVKSQADTITATFTVLYSQSGQNQIRIFSPTSDSGFTGATVNLYDSSNTLLASGTNTFSYLNTLFSNGAPLFAALPVGSSGSLTISTLETVALTQLGTVSTSTPYGDRAIQVGFENSGAGGVTQPLTSMTLQSSGPSSVPEPSSLFLLGTGLAGGIGAVRRKLKK